MLTKLRKALFPAAATQGEAERREELLASMRATRSALNRAYDGFNRTADSDLIESYVFEIQSLQHRYSYLLRQLRELEPLGMAE